MLLTYLVGQLEPKSNITECDSTNKVLLYTATTLPQEDQSDPAGKYSWFWLPDLDQESGLIIYPRLSRFWQWVQYQVVHEMVLVLHKSCVCRPSTGMPVEIVLYLSTRDTYVGFSTGLCRIYMASTSKMAFYCEMLDNYMIFTVFSPTWLIIGLVMFITG
jgi:hypothetical protein